MPLSIVIVSRYTILSFSILFSSEFLRNILSSENVDKLIFLFHIIGFLYFYRYRRYYFRYKIKKKEIFFSVIASAILIIGILKENVVIARNRTGEEVNSLWNGFGFEVLCTLVIILIFSVIYVKKESAYRISKNLSVSLSVILVSVYTLSIWQTKNSLIDFNHTEFILNESLAFSSESFPYSNFIPQYSMLYNLFVWPLSNFLSVDNQLDFVFIILFLASILTLVISVLIVKSSFDSRNYLKSILLVIPLALVTPGLGREWVLGSISTLFSAIPNRIFPAVILFALYYFKIIKSITKRNVKIKVFSIGVLAGCIFWQSQDFGTATILSLMLTILITNALNLKEKIKHLSHFIPGMLIGISIYPFFLFIFNKPVRIEYLAFFARQFGSGFGAEPIIPLGPIMIILPIIFIVFYFHIEFNKLNQDSRKQLLNNSFIGIFFSLFTLFAFPYYLNRSIASGQLQIFLLPLSIALGSLIGSFTKIGFFQEIRSYIRNNQLSRIVILLPLLIIFSLPFSVISLFPNPMIEVPRVLEKNKDLAWPPAKLSITLDNIDTALKFSKDENVEVAFFGSFSNYIYLKKNVEVVNLYNSAYDFYLSKETRKYGCAYLISKSPQYLILDHSASEIFKIDMDKTKNENFCGKYKFSSKLKIEPYFFAEKIK
jgi:hypothetical protein